MTDYRPALTPDAHAAEARRAQARQATTMGERVEAYRTLVGEAPARDTLWPLTQTESWCCAILIAAWLGLLAGTWLALANDYG